MEACRVWAIERTGGEGQIKDGDGVMLKHISTGLYAQSESDQYPVVLRAKQAGLQAQIFIMYKLGHPLNVRHNDEVYFQSWLSNYVENSQTITGEPVIVARRWRRAPETSFTMFKKLVVEQSTTELARRMQFQSFDMDGNGSIGKGEMAYMLKSVKYGDTLMDSELDEVMAACADDEGNATYEKFAEWANGGGLTEDQLQHGEVIGNTAQRCNDALNEEAALIEVLTTAGMSQITAMKAEYATRWPNEDGSPGDLPAAIAKKASEQDGWIFSNNWKTAMQGLMEDEVDLWTRCLNEAMAGWGTDEDSLTYLVCTIPERIRNQIFVRYNERFGKGLLEHISSETSGKYKKVLEMQAMAPEDCRARFLYEAMKGCGTSEDQLIRIFCQCDLPERRQIKEAFLRMYSRTLDDWVASETSGNFKKSLMAMLAATEQEFDIEKDCQTIEASMNGWGTDESALLNAVCSKTPKQMEQLNEKFMELFARDLLAWVKSETSGNFQAVLMGCIRGPMKQLAHSVRDCMKGWGTAELGLLTMLVHLPDFKKAALVKQYRIEFPGRDLIKDIKGDCSGDFEKALLALVKPSPQVWAEAITASMKGLGTSDNLLINFMCVAKDEMGEVRRNFKVLNKKTLVQWVEGDCSGDYKRTLAALANRNTEDDPTMKPVYWAQRARDAVQDVECLKNILVSLPCVAIQRGMEVYQAVYKKSLTEKIGEKCGESCSWFAWTDWYKNGMLRLCEMPVELYVKALNDAMQGWGTDESSLTALVCTMPPNMYGDIHRLYEEKYGRTLLNHIEGDCSFAYKRLMMAQAADWPQSRAMALNNALAGLGTTENQLIRIIANSTMAQRVTIKAAYKEMFKKGLIAHIEEDTSGNFGACLVAMLESAGVGEEDEQNGASVPEDCCDYENDCNVLKEAMDGAGTDEDQLVRILACKTDQQIQNLRAKYEEMFGENLYAKIDDETWDCGTGWIFNGSFRQTLLALLRPPLERLACAVRDCIVGIGTDDTGLITLLVHLSEKQKRELVDKYMDIKNGGDLIAHIKGDTMPWAGEGSYQDALLRLIQPAPVTWAQAMKKAMAGLGTSDNKLINICCIAKDRMDETREAFLALNDQELSQWLDGDCSGDYKDLLIKLANRECYKYPGSEVMVQKPPPPSSGMALYTFSCTFNKLCQKKKADPSQTVTPTEMDYQEMANAFMYYGAKSPCAPNLDTQGLLDLLTATGFIGETTPGWPWTVDTPDMAATFLEWNYSCTGEICWNDFTTEMKERANCDAHYNADLLPQNPPPGMNRE